MRQILLLALVAFLIFFPFYSYAQDDTKSNPQVETQQIIDIETEKDDNESKEIDIDKLDIRQVENKSESKQIDNNNKDTMSIVNFTARRRIYNWWYIYKWGRKFDPATAIYKPFALRLADSSKFALIEKEDMESLLKKNKLDVSGDIKPETVKEVGKLLGTRYIVTGLVKNFDLVKTSSRSHGINIGRFGFETEYHRIYNLKMVCKIDIFDTTTGEMVYTTTVKRKIKHLNDGDLIYYYRIPLIDKETGKRATSPLEKEINELVDELIDNIESENFEKEGYVPKVEKK